MQIIKFGIISVVILFLVFTGISLFIPSRVNISRAINLYADPDSVFQLIKDTSRWAEWYPGYDTMRLKGTSVSFLSVEKNKLVAEFKSQKAKTIASTWQVITYEKADSVTLQWYMHFKLRWYPWEKFGSLLYEKAYGSQMENGLNNISRVFQK